MIIVERLLEDPQVRKLLSNQIEMGKQLLDSGHKSFVRKKFRLNEVVIDVVHHICDVAAFVVAGGGGEVLKDYSVRDITAFNLCSLSI